LGDSKVFPANRSNCRSPPTKRACSPEHGTRVSKSDSLHIPSLDGIRGLAAMTVFVAHAGLGDVVPGGFGVTVFFFLSGYLITSLLRIEYERGGRVSLKNFYLRRIYRIIPPMYLVLTASILLGAADLMSHAMTPQALVAQFAHLTNYYDLAVGSEGFAPGTAVMWSLSVEEHFYLLFPLCVSLLFVRLKYERIAGILLLVCAMVLAWRCLLVAGFGVSDLYTYEATDTRLDSILFGCILGVWCNPALDKPFAPLERRAQLWVAGAAALLLVSFVLRDPFFRQTFRYSIQGIALLPLFYCAVRYCHWPMFSWLESRPMRALGLISYTFYLTHLICISLVHRFHIGRLWEAAASLTATILVSTVMYLLVERHMAVLRRRLHASRTAKPAMRASGVSAT
jgi:peptidoglycan/LPS O-acetylase OafA/YrhL